MSLQLTPIIERQLRQIDDSLKNNNIKSALQQCQKRIEQYPNVTIFKALNIL